jgi:hypothetical protein
MTLSPFHLVLLTGMLALTSCTDTPNAPVASTEAPKELTPNEPVTGKTAFWAMYKPAYAWSRDLVILALGPKDLPGFKSGAGKAPMWTATFGSPANKEARTWTYTIAKFEDTPRGLSVGRAISWYGPRQEAMPFTTSDLGVDSDIAYDTAAKAAAPWTKKHPNAPLTYSLGHATRFPVPVWYFKWGDAKQGFGAFVNSRTGELLKLK